MPCLNHVLAYRRMCSDRAITENLTSMSYGYRPKNPWFLFLFASEAGKQEEKPIFAGAAGPSNSR